MTTTLSAARQETGFVAAGAERNTGTWTAGLRRAWVAYRAYRATLSELAALSDGQLSDIGLRRETLKDTARRAVRGN